MEQAVLHSELPDEDRHYVLKYMETRDKEPGKASFLLKCPKCYTTILTQPPDKTLL